MFSPVIVEFPNSTAAPQFVYKLTLHQNRYKHEIAVIQFRDWGASYDAVQSGSPITFTIVDVTGKREFIGYVHSVTRDQSPSKNITEVMAVGPSYKMKSPHQRIYKDMSADGIIQQIASEYRFNAYTVAHPRVYPQVSQAGHTDWEFMVRLAKQCGYSLRTQNTEIYMQPVLQDFTLKREEAPRFYMNEANSNRGSTIYSFSPLISESIEHDGDRKAAIAVSGTDERSTSILSITQQTRPRKTKVKSKPEFFDKFATNIVATDPMVAKYEAEAAEQRASFPYRAEARVIGHVGLRPDFPVFLEGIGDYSGYWVILGTEHVIEEQQRGLFLYTTTLHLGTDSLGSASVWEDGKVVLAPDYTPKRTLIPGVRQTNNPPQSSLLRTAPNVGPQSNGTFSTATNRPSARVNNRIVSAPNWVAKTKTPNPITQPPKKTQAFPNRLLSKITSIL